MYGAVPASGPSDSRIASARAAASARGSPSASASAASVARRVAMQADVGARPAAELLGVDVDAHQRAVEHRRQQGRGVEVVRLGELGAHREHHVGGAERLPDRAEPWCARPATAGARPARRPCRSAWSRSAAPMPLRDRDRRVAGASAPPPSTTNGRLSRPRSAAAARATAAASATGRTPRARRGGPIPPRAGRARRSARRCAPAAAGATRRSRRPGRTRRAARPGRRRAIDSAVMRAHERVLVGQVVQRADAARRDRGECVSEQITSIGIESWKAPGDRRRGVRRRRRR